MSGRRLFAGGREYSYYNVSHEHVADALYHAYGQEVETDNIDVFAQESFADDLDIDEAEAVSASALSMSSNWIAENASQRHCTPLIDPITINYRGQSCDCPIDRTVIVNCDELCQVSQGFISTVQQWLRVYAESWRAHLYATWNDDDDLGLTLYPDGWCGTQQGGATGHEAAVIVKTWVNINRSRWELTRKWRDLQFKYVEKEIVERKASVANWESPCVVASFDHSEHDEKSQVFWVGWSGKLSRFVIESPPEASRCGWFDIRADRSLGPYGRMASDAVFKVVEFRLPAPVKAHQLRIKDRVTHREVTLPIEHIVGKADLASGVGNRY